MKWYWIVTIIVLSVIVGFWLSRKRLQSEPIKQNTQRIISDLQSELDNINNWLAGPPNNQDPNYPIQRQKYLDRKQEIINMLKNFFGCTNSVNIIKNSNGTYSYNCNDISNNV